MTGGRPECRFATEPIPFPWPVDTRPFPSVAFLNEMT
jgi:hypothetical protein